MNFFDQQHQKKKITRRLFIILFFVLAILALILNVSIGFILSYGTEHPTSSAIEILKMPTIGIIPLWAFINFIVFFFAILGFISQFIAIRRGGMKFASSLGAVHADKITEQIIHPDKIKRLLNVVDEISIASGIPKPSVFILSQEQGLNAFVAGLEAEDRVLVLTKGAVEKFSREELQGVIGHEFGHLTNDDVSINLNLFCLIAGLSMIYNIGSTIIDIEYRTNFRSSSNIKSNNNKDNKLAAQVYMIGISFLIIGYLGVFFTRLMQKAVSRQREYLADACSVQFTRNNEGLALALYRIHKGEQTVLHCKQKGNLNHLCLFPSEKITLFSSLLSTHPPILDRIQQIYDGNIEKLEQKLRDAPSHTDTRSH